MHSKQESMEALTTFAQKLQEDDLHEIQKYAEYLVEKRIKQEPHIHVNELMMQHEENTKLLITYILQRSRLITILTRLANIILHAEKVSDEEKREAQSAMQHANWILRGNTSYTEEKS